MKSASFIAMGLFNMMVLLDDPFISRTPFPRNKNCYMTNYRIECLILLVFKYKRHMMGNNCRGLIHRSFSAVIEPPVLAIADRFEWH